MSSLSNSDGELQTEDARKVKLLKDHIASVSTNKEIRRTLDQTTNKMNIKIGNTAGHKTKDSLRAFDKYE